MSAATVVFVHGMYMTPACWQSWVERYERQGFNCLAPGWPEREAQVDALRQRHPDPQAASLTLTQVLDHLARFIGALDHKPVLVGHSMGGLAVQLLVQRGLAAAGVAIDSAPPAGVLSLEWSFIKANWAHANPLVPKTRPVFMDFERFQYAFANGMPLAQQRKAYDEFVVPESRRIPAESLTSTARIDFRRPGAPLLLIAGSDDHIIPASLNRANFDKYQRPGSITDFQEFAGRNHFIIGQAHWEEVADHTAAWIRRVVP